MKPAWDDLASEYEGSSVLIADVDCTVEADLCQRFDVSGYPTIKYFTDETDPKGDSYNGGRSLDDLKKFVVDKLEAKCDASDPEGSGCTEKEQKYIAKQSGKDGDAIKAQIDRLEKMKGSSMKAELKVWLNQRVRILKQMLPEEKDEL